MQNMIGKRPEICRLLEVRKGGEQVEREQIEKLLSELGLSGKGLDIVADAVELHKEGMAMMQLYQMMGRTRGMCRSAIANRIKRMEPENRQDAELVSILYSMPYTQKSDVSAADKKSADISGN